MTPSPLLSGLMILSCSVSDLPKAIIMATQPMMTTKTANIDPHAIRRVRTHTMRE